jgi:hypothetical protein
MALNGFDSLWTLPSGTKLATIQERFSVNIPLPLALFFDDIDVEIISGSLPLGTRLENNTIVGTPFEVSFDTLSTFVLRATQGDLTEDRTYQIVTVGADAPEWITPEGLAFSWVKRVNVYTRQRNY